MLVQNTSPRVPLEHVLFVIGPRREPIEPFLSDVDLALSGAGVDLFKPVRGGVDEAVISKGFEESLAREPDDLAFLAVRINGEEFYHSVGNFGGGRVGAREEVFGVERERWEALDLGGELPEDGGRHRDEKNGGSVRGVWLC